MKKFAKVFMLIACVAMVFCFAAGVSASETNANAVTVTINIQELVRAYDSDGDGIYDARYENPTANILDGDTVEAELTDTLYDVIVDAGFANAYGVNPSCWDLVNITEWDDETQSFVSTGETAYALTRINYDGGSKVNNSSYPSQNFYQGSSWMWYAGTAIPAPGTWGATDNYPTDYLSQVTVADLVNNNYTFTLSYETDFMTW